MKKINWYDLTIGEENRRRPYLSTSEDDLHGFTSYQLEQGNRVERWQSDSWVRSSCNQDDGEPDDLLATALSLPIVSQGLRCALDAAGVASNDIQYLPIKVFKSTGEEVQGYAIANVISRIMALDYEKCFLLMQDDQKIDPLTDKPGIRGIGKIALKATPLVGHDVIRLIEFWPALVVSGRFKKVFDEGRFTGATFSPLKVS
jgi:hypothetical protein